MYIITEVVLFYYNISNNDYQQDSRVKFKFVLTESLDQLLDISPKKEVFSRYLIQSFHILKYALRIKILNY